MLHPAEIANLQQTIDRTHAAMGTLTSIEQELRLIKKGMAPGAEKTRVEQMLRLTRETIAGLQRKLPMLDHARSSPGTGGADRAGGTRKQPRRSGAAPG